jgi:hypothetical protein
MCILILLFGKLVLKLHHDVNYLINVGVMQSICFKSSEWRLLKFPSCVIRYTRLMEQQRLVLGYNLI